MSSKRQDVLEYLKTLLATITIGNGYNFTVKNVERGIRNIREMGADDFPSIFITMTHEVRELRTVNQFSADLQVILVGYVKNTKGDIALGGNTGVQLDLDKFIADVTKCLETDRLQGGLVYKTFIKEVATDDGDTPQTSGFVMSVIMSYVTEGITP